MQQGLLKEKKVLRDKELESWQRIAIREIKDFAMMLNVNFNKGQEVFWKWYLTPDEEAKQKIMGVLKKEMPSKKEEQEKEAKKEEKEIKKEPEKKEKQFQKEDKKHEIDEFYGQINTYFTENRIRVIEEKAIRKNTEYEFTIEIPSALGNLKYFVKARNKKKISDAELNMSYTLGEKKKLPTIVISTGDLTKKAEKYLENELKGLIFKKLR